MVKVRVTDLRFVALALLLLASLTTAKPVKNINRSWRNPCDVAFTVKTRRQAPQGSHLKINRPLATQLKITRDGFCDEWVKVAPMYNSIEAMKKKFHNIPDDTLTWYNKAKTVNNETLHRLHVNLQHFLIGLESMEIMESMNLTKGLLVQDNKIRYKFFHKISREAKLLLCEVETFVNISNVPKPEPQPEYDPCRGELDHGTAVLLGCEKSFFTLYSSFLDSFFDKNSKRNPKICAKHRQRKGTKENRRLKNRDANKRRHKNSGTGPEQSQP